MSYFVKQLKRQPSVGRTIKVRTPGYDFEKRTLHFYDFAWQPSGCSPSDKEEARRDRIRDRVTKIQAEEFGQHGDLYYCELDLSSNEAKTRIGDCSLVAKVFRCKRRQQQTGIGLIDSLVCVVGAFEGYAYKSNQRGWVLQPCDAEGYLEHYGVKSYDDLAAFGSVVHDRFAERFPKRVPEPEGVYPSFESLPMAIAWIASESKRLDKHLWVSKNEQIRFDVGEWVVSDRCPILVECYDEQGIRHG